MPVLGGKVYVVKAFPPVCACTCETFDKLDTQTQCYLSWTYKTIRILWVRWKEQCHSMKTLESHTYNFRCYQCATDMLTDWRAARFKAIKIYSTISVSGMFHKHICKCEKFINIVWMQARWDLMLSSMTSSLWFWDPLAMGLVRPGRLGYHGKLTGPRIFLVHTYPGWNDKLELKDTCARITSRSSHLHNKLYSD